MRRISRKEALEISTATLLRAEEERIEHNTDSPDCWCDPDIEELDNGNLLVIHRDKSEGN